MFVFKTVDVPPCNLLVVKDCNLLPLSLYAGVSVQNSINTYFPNTKIPKMPWSTAKTNILCSHLFLQALLVEQGLTVCWFSVSEFEIISRPLIGRKYHRHWGRGRWAPQRQNIVETINVNDNICCSRKTRKITKVWAELCHTRT